MASPGMMQSGLSRELFESWCTDKRNGVIIAGYCVEGTLAKVGAAGHAGKQEGEPVNEPKCVCVVLQHIMTEPDEITTMSGQKLLLKMSVDYISFSAHTDYQQTSEFIRALKPPHVVNVHRQHAHKSLHLTLSLKALLSTDPGPRRAERDGSSQGRSDPRVRRQ